MGELIFVGLGLHDEMDISLRGLETVKQSDFVFAEFYTSLMSGISKERLERETGKKIQVLSRRHLEDEEGKLILQKAVKGSAVLLVPGDPLIATTHIDLRIRAERRGIKTRIIHGASIISAVIGLSGLQNYRFGRSVTIPFPHGRHLSETPYEVISENKTRNLHTLCFLDIEVEEGRFMTINDSMRILSTLEDRKQKGTITPETIAVGIARAGSEDPLVKADHAKNLLSFEYGNPPHSLIIPAGHLHFMEADALITLADAPDDVRRMVR
ncbi:MAG: diphthine synthase [Candidatus Bathyarchaeota archaeon]|nr:diphthine synthase [Candidatus Bathyarchaeota archaeon]